jgi:hypothetical protein
LSEEHPNTVAGGCVTPCAGESLATRPSESDVRLLSGPPRDAGWLFSGSGTWQPRWQPRDSTPNQRWPFAGSVDVDAAMNDPATAHQWCEDWQQQLADLDVEEAARPAVPGVDPLDAPEG